jgi:hypothetical protein
VLTVDGLEDGSIEVCSLLRLILEKSTCWAHYTFKVSINVFVCKIGIHLLILAQRLVPFKIKLQLPRLLQLSSVFITSRHQGKGMASWCQDCTRTLHIASKAVARILIQVHIRRGRGPGRLRLKHVMSVSLLKRFHVKVIKHLS